MKKSEFKRKIEDLGFHIETDKYGRVKIFTDIDYDDYFMAIGILGTGDLSVEADSLGKTEKYAKAVKLAVDYAFTPLADREDEPRFYVAIAPGKYLMRQMGEYIILGITERNWASGFTPNTYTQTLLNQPQWGPFLPPYDADNTDVFVPVEEDDEDK